MWYNKKKKKKKKQPVPGGQWIQFHCRVKQAKEVFFFQRNILIAIEVFLHNPLQNVQIFKIILQLR